MIAGMLAVISIPGVPPGLRFEAPWALALLVVPLVLLAWNPLRKRRPAAVVPLAPGVTRLPRSLRTRLLWLPRVCQLLAACLLIISLARPQLGEGRSLRSTQAVAIQLVVDRSGSMRAPMEFAGQSLTRLDVVKRVVREFLIGTGGTLQGRPDDLVGLVSFARIADTVCPLVRDHAAVADLTDSIELAQGFLDGTAIGDGLSLAAARLRTAEQDLKSRSGRNSTDESLEIKSKVVVLLTDGQANAGMAPLEAAKVAAQWGIRVYCVGIASEGFELRQTFRGVERVRVAADVDEATLRGIAEATGGRFWRAENGDTLREIYQEIDRLEKTAVKSLEYVEYTELFVPMAAAGVGLLVLEALLRAGPLRRWPA